MRWVPLAQGTTTWALKVATARRIPARRSQGFTMARMPTPNPWAATISEPSDRCCMPMSPPSTAAMGSTMPRLSGTLSRSRGTTHRKGAPMEKISLDSPTTS